MRQFSHRNIHWFVTQLLCWCLFCINGFSAAAAAENALTKAYEMEVQLKQISIQPIDRAEFAREHGLLNGELNPLPAPPHWQAGMDEDFFVINTRERETFEINAKLVYAGQHVIYWVDSSHTHPLSEAVFQAFREFDMVFYPMLKGIFGSELDPGVDQDPYVHALFTGRIGTGLLGYFSSRDADHPAVSPHSNAKELFLLTTRMLNERPQQITNTLSHEYQHMIHFAHDPNENSIIDEGLSGLAEYLIGNRLSDVYESSFLSDPNVSLSLWPVDESGIPSYGASFLFMKYLADRVGLAAISELVAEEKNGFYGIDAVLAGTPHKQNGLTADSLFSEWTLANLLASLGINDAEIGYHDYQPPTSPIDRIIHDLNCETGTSDFKTQQYGTSYYRLNCPGQALKVTIQGNPTAMLLDITTDTQDILWWSNAANNSLTRLEQEFDLRGLASPTALEYEIRYKIEVAYDFLYLSLSDDDGKSWQFLETAHGTDRNDSGFNLGWGYTGNSGGWLHEKIALDPWLGKRVKIRFEMVTDQAMTDDGALIRSIQLLSDGKPIESDPAAPNWQASGFVQLTNAVPQPFSLVSVSGNRNAPVFSTGVFQPPFAQTVICESSQEEAGSWCIFGVSPISRWARTDGEYQITVDKMDL